MELKDLQNFRESARGKEKKQFQNEIDDYFLKNPPKQKKKKERRRKITNPDDMWW